MKFVESIFIVSVVMWFYLIKEKKLENILMVFGDYISRFYSWLGFI